MKLHSIYAAPNRVYLCFFLLGILGIFCFQTLPISLFPNSARPQIGAEIPYGNLTRDGFLTTYGKEIENKLHAIQSKSCTADQVEAHYETKGVFYDIRFSWGNDGTACFKEVQQLIATFQSQWPPEIQRRTYTWQNSKGVGFFLASFNSEQRTEEGLFAALEPLLRPQLAAIREIDRIWINDPAAKQITLELAPAKMAAFKLRPKDILKKIQDAMTHYNTGEIKVGAYQISLEAGTPFADPKELGQLLIAKTPEKKIYLSEIANIKLEPATKERNLTTLNGASSVLLFVKPAPGKNIRDMSQKILTVIEKTLKANPQLSDIHFKVMVNPKDLIDESISNVLREVGICSLLAVLILFFFIGTFSGTLPALLEIPLSLLLSFILMKWVGVQINMISLGGLALSVGMNVDASIVVIDSILKRFASLKNTLLSKTVIVSAVAEAVQEVYLPVILSTVTSLIVFIPLSFTSDLTESILGDLAKAVIFSHGISLFIALLLVPCIRVHMALRFGIGSEHHSIHWIEYFLKKLYLGYEKSLEWVLERKFFQWSLYAASGVALIAVLTWIPPQLRREIIGVPETSIIEGQIQVFQSAQHVQVQSYIAKFERQIREVFSDKIAFTFANVYQKDRAWFWVGLKEKAQGAAMLEALQEMTKQTLDAKYEFYPFNPAELPLPHPPDWEVSFLGSKTEIIQSVQEDFRVALLDQGIFSNWQPDPPAAFDNMAQLIPISARWANIQTKFPDLSLSDLGQMVSLATDPIEILQFPFQDKQIPVMATYPPSTITSLADIESLPVPLDEKVIPFRALVQIKTEKAPSNLYRTNGEDTFKSGGSFSEEEKKQEKKIRHDFSRFLNEFKISHETSGVTITQEETQTEMHQALRELLLATSISIGLIFLVLYLQFASLIHTLIIMLAIPLGLLGVFPALYIFHSTLSVNSALGIILLIGITVANSIMLVEKILHLHQTGISPKTAILETAQKRIRPILMTSLITILGMLPIAIGAGDGGKILQPLGIAVCGGLWVSLLFTLYLVPTLEYAYLRRTRKH